MRRRWTGWEEHCCRNLRSHKVGGVARCHQQAILGPQLLGEAEVADPDGLGVAALVHVEDVAGLQVPVHHLQPGQGGEHQANWMDIMSQVLVQHCSQDLQYPASRRQWDVSMRSEEVRQVPTPWTCRYSRVLVMV